MHYLRISAAFELCAYVDDAYLFSAHKPPQRLIPYFRIRLCAVHENLDRKNATLCRYLHLRLHNTSLEKLA
jgi:hypothetical protein